MRRFFTQATLALLTFTGAGGVAQAWADGIVASTAESPKWYRMYTPNRGTRAVTSNGTASPLTGTTITVGSGYTRGQLWRFEESGSNTYHIVSYDGLYISPTGTANNTGFTPVSEKPSTGWNINAITDMSDLYTIVQGSNQFNQTESSHSYQVFNWGSGSTTTDSGCQYRFEEVDLTDLSDLTLSSASVSSGLQTFAPSQVNATLLSFTPTLTGVTGSYPALKSAQISFAGDSVDMTAFDTLKVWRTTDKNFATAKGTGTLVAQVVKPTSTSVNFTFDKSEQLGLVTYNYYVTASLSKDAKVGTTMDAVLDNLGYTIDNTEKTLTLGTNPEGVGYVYTQSSIPFRCYEKDSHYWRIPAMVTLRHQKETSKNGRVVVMADMRFNHNSDLNAHIDVYSRYSDDQGKTWSTPELAAGSTEDHKLTKYTGSSTPGFGDAALVETKSGKIVAIMASGNSYWSSTAASPIEPFIVTSTDGGETWTDPKSLYEAVYTNATYAEGTLNGTFAGSGRGLMLERQQDSTRNGRILFAMSHRLTGTSAIQEYIIYSDDEGETWKMSTQSAYSGGDESKLVELADGTVMISVRQGGNRGFNKSTDGGLTWGAQSTNSTISGNACNGDILYYNKHLLVHSYVNNSSRKNVSVAVSYDDGATWTNQRAICVPASAYSTLDVTSDNEVAIFYEDASCTDGYNLVYAKFPITWVAPDINSLCQTALDAAVTKAKAVVALGSYTEVASSTSGQVDSKYVTQLNELLTKASSTTLTDDEKDNLTDSLTKYTTLAYTSQCAVDGYDSSTAFNIKSLQQVNGVDAYLSTSCTPINFLTSAQWYVIPTGTSYQVYIKDASTGKYLYRNGNQLGTQTAAYAWNLKKSSDNTYYNIQSTSNGQSYICIDVTGANTGLKAYNFYSQAGSTQWSTKFVITPESSKLNISSTTTAPADLTAGYYVIDTKVKGSTGPLKHTPDGSFKFPQDASVSYDKVNSEEYVWYVTKTDNGLVLQNASTGGFIPADATQGQNMTTATTQDKAAVLGYTTDGITDSYKLNDNACVLYQRQYKVNNNALYVNANGTKGAAHLSYWNATGGNVVDDNSIQVQFAFHPVTGYASSNITKAVAVKVTDTDKSETYSAVTSGNKISGTADMDISYWYDGTMGATYEESDLTVSATNATFTITGYSEPKLNTSTLPFELSTEESPVWYTINFRNSTSNYLVHQAVSDNNMSSKYTLTNAGSASYSRFLGALWAFVEDSYGVKLLNKQTGKYVKATNSNNAKATLTTASDATVFIGIANTNTGFSLKIKDTEKGFMGDHASNCFGTWTGTTYDTMKNDGGSNFTVTKVDASSDILNVGKTAITTDLTAKKAAQTTDNYLRVDYDKALSNVSSATVSSFSELEALYDLQPAAPEANAYYRLVSASGLTKKYLSSANVCVGTDGKLLTAYNANNNLDRSVTRVDADGALAPQLFTLEGSNGTFKIRNANNASLLGNTGGSQIDYPTLDSWAGTYTLTAKPNLSFSDTSLSNDGESMFLLSVGGKYANATSDDNSTLTFSTDANDAKNYWRVERISEVPVSISSALYATVAFPFAVKLPEDSNVKAYYGTTASNGCLTLKEFADGIIPANTGAVLQADEATTVNLEITTTETTVENKLSAATAERTGFETKSTYVLALDDDDTACFLLSELTCVPANKAYLALDHYDAQSGQASALAFHFGEQDDITGIDTTTTESTPQRYYDLQGHPVLYPSHGIYINSAGEKVLIP